jgi:hypothetical protein
LGGIRLSIGFLHCSGASLVQALAIAAKLAEPEGFGIGSVIDRGRRERYGKSRNFRRFGGFDGAVDHAMHHAPER